MTNYLCLKLTKILKKEFDLIPILKKNKVIKIFLDLALILKSNKTKNKKIKFKKK